MDRKALPQIVACSPEVETNPGDRFRNLPSGNDFKDESVTALLHSFKVPPASGNLHCFVQHFPTEIHWFSYAGSLLDPVLEAAEACGLYRTRPDNFTS